MKGLERRVNLMIKMGSDLGGFELGEGVRGRS